MNRDEPKPRTPIFGGALSVHILSNGKGKLIRVYTNTGIYLHMIHGINLDPDGTEADWIKEIESANGSKGFDER